MTSYLSLTAERKPSTASSICSRASRGNYNLTKNQILVKVSHVNDALHYLKTKIYDDEEKAECRFVRILRIGPGTQNESTLPGALIIVHCNRGIFLEELSEKHGEEYYLLLESDIKTYIDL